MAVRERAKCPECGRLLAVQPPKGGDGSVDVYPRHNYIDGPERGRRCPMGRSEVDQSEYLEPDESP